MRAVDDLFKKYVAKFPEIKSFGSGPKSYGNLDESPTPRVWRHLVRVNDTHEASGKLHSIYNIWFDFSAQCDYTTNTDDINKVFDELEPIYVSFMNALLCDKEYIDFSVEPTIQREQLIHDLDQNLVGWMVSLRIKLRQKAILKCPTN